MVELVYKKHLYNKYEDSASVVLVCRACLCACHIIPVNYLEGIIMKPVLHFQNYFAIEPVVTKAQREKSFFIRHQVYCRELGFEPYREGEPPRETDEYDDRSRHCLLIHKPSKRAIGSVRLILADDNKPESPLPFERHCSAALDKSFFDPDQFLPGQVAEFSRIAVLEEFRRREKHEANTNNMAPAIHDERRASAFPVIPISLFLASLSMLENSEAEIGFAMMEPKLERLLRRYGIVFESAGDPVDYHGWRAPYIIHRDNIGRHFKHGVGEIYFEVNRILCKTEEVFLNTGLSSA